MFTTEQGSDVIGLMIELAATMNSRILEDVSDPDRQVCEDVPLRVKRNLKDVLRQQGGLTLLEGEA